MHSAVDSHYKRHCATLTRRSHSRRLALLPGCNRATLQEASDCAHVKQLRTLDVGLQTVSALHFAHKHLLVSVSETSIPETARCAPGYPERAHQRTTR